MDMKDRSRTSIKLIALLAAAVLLAAAACVPCYADAGNGTVSEAFLSYLADCAKKGMTEIDVSEFGVRKSEENMETIKDYLFNRHPELFLLNGVLTYSFYSDGQLASISFEYVCSVSEYRTRLSKVEAAADKLLQGIEGNSSLTDVQKALLLHDRLALHCQYDRGIYTSQGAGPNARNIYGSLVERVAVCDGYSRAYIYLLNRVGIRCRFVLSEALYHSWNIVYIDGRAYHVDVTFDDPTIDMTGRVNHYYFLLSSDTLYQRKHEANDYDTEPTDTRYDNYFWEKSNAAFLLAGGQVYYIDNNAATLNRFDGQKVLSLSSDWGGWYTDGIYRNFCYARGATDGTVLLYTDKKSVYEYDPASGKTKTVFTPSDPTGQKMIFGMALENGRIICEFTETASRSSQDYTVDKSGMLVTTAYAEHVPAVRRGDPDGDGTISSADARLALRASVKLENYARGSARYIACDVDRAGDVTSTDARLILRASVGLEDASRWG